MNAADRREAEFAAPVTRLRSPRFVAGFTRYARWYVRRTFSGVRLQRECKPVLPEGRPAIVYTNHPSWWDPLIFLILAAHLFPGRPGFGPMEAAALRNYPFMRRLGIYGIEGGSLGGAAAFMFTGAGLLRDPSAMLWVTAEGRFTDVRKRPVSLLPGVGQLASRAPEAVLVPLALEYPFWDERYPEALAAFGKPIDAGSLPRDARTATEQLEHGLMAAMSGLAEAAISRDAAQFQPVLSGNAGVGGTYDLWRRMKAWSRGREFTPRHSPNNR